MGQFPPPEIQDFHLRDVKNVLRHLLQLDAEQLAVFFPQGFYDSIALTTEPTDPKFGRLRAFFFTVDGVTSWRIKDDTGAIIATLPSLEQRFGDLLPDEFLFGDGLNYIDTFGPSDEDIQYTCVPLPKDETLTSMRTIFNTFTGGNANLRMGIYDQADPTSGSDEPRNKIAETGIAVVSGIGIQDVSLTSPLIVPATGFYWIASVLDTPGGNKGMASSGNIPADFLQIRHETGAGAAALPATAGGLTNPGGPVVLATAKV